MLASVLLLVAPNSACAFDGKRTGFIFGGGFGVTPMVNLSTSHESYHFSSTKTGAAVDLAMGFGVSRYNVLALDVQVASYTTDYTGDHTRVVQGLVGTSWCHYFGPEGHAFFLTGGTGIYRAKEDLGGVSIDICINCGPEPAHPYLPETWGWGFMVGAGREFAPHLHAGAYYSVGFPTGDVYAPPVTVSKHATGEQLSLMLTVLAY